MKRSKSKNLYFKWPFRENILASKTKKKKQKKQKNAKTQYAKKYFRKMTTKKAVNNFLMQSNALAIIEVIEK